MADSKDGPNSSAKIEDEVISQRAFEVGEGLDLNRFMVTESELEESAEEAEEIEEKLIDEAIGELPQLFTTSDNTDDSDVMDPLRSEAVEAEQRVHWSMMVTMIVLWSIIGTYVGLTFSASIAGPALFAMALFSLWLANKWIPDPNMRILGTTWAIISMKLFYGLAIDLHHWGLLEGIIFSEDILLGILLLGMVVLNIVLAYHFDEDAIAAQATLVLLAIGSAAGALYGELGVALMIGLATLVLHSLALMRNSGNLTSLGVAASNLWIGLHALSSGWSIFGLSILAFDDSLILLLLILFVNAANATMAAHFAKYDNWFSQGFAALGLGRPGLWGVSVGLGMFGALLAIFANREDTGFALAQISILLTAFGASYLVVRGVSHSRVIPIVMPPIPFLVAALVLFDTGVFSPPIISAHGIFAIGMCIVAAISILRNQDAVSDHVLWSGTLIISLLATILIPSDQGEYGDLLLVTILLIFAASGGFAVKRSSPSIAGTAVIAPWIWILLFATDVENRFVSVDILPIVLNPESLTFFMFGMGLLQVGINLTMGETGVDLGKAFGNGTEALARIKDSGVLKLWPLGWIFALLGWLAVARPDGLPALGLVFGLVTLAAMHISVQSIGRHVNQRRFMMITLAVATLWVHWRFGLTLAWVPLVAVAGVSLTIDASRKISEDPLDIENKPESLYTLMFSFIAIHLLLASLGLETQDLLQGAYWPSQSTTIWVVIATTILTLTYLFPNVANLERPLGPSLACVVMLLALIIWSNSVDSMAFLISWILFAASGLWLVSRAEVRLGLASIAKAEEKIQSAVKRQDDVRIGIVGAQAPENSENETGVGLIDAELVHQAAKQAKRRKRSGSIGESDLVAGDVFYSPTIALVFVSLVCIFASWWSYFNGNGEAMLLFAALLSLSAVMLAQQRSRNLEMRMPDILGIETPVALTVGGLVLVHLAGRISQRYVDPDAQLGLLLLALSLCVLAWSSLIGRSDLALRLPSALEWILYGLVADRMATMFLSGGTPPPMQVDPFTGTFLEWQMPWITLEIILISALFLFDMVERKRLERDLQDHRGADGRTVWILMVMIVSWGPATLLAAILALMRARSWNQPGLAVTAIILLPISITQSNVWLDLSPNLPGIATSATGTICLGLLAYTVFAGQARWSTTWLWDIHILLPIGALLISGGADALGVVSVLAVSAAAWITGVLEERRSWRVVGFLDLLAAWVLAGLAISVGELTASLLLPMLLASVALLGVVTWLGQSHKDRLAID